MPGTSRRKILAMLAVTPLAGGVVAQAAGLDNLLLGFDSLPEKTEDASREKTRKKYFPNFELTTHEGKRVKFYDDLIKDKIVVINFMYAKCEGICVPITENLKRVQKLLGNRVGKDIFMYSITLKPEEDTPEKLKHYVHMHHIKPGWTFLTGKPDEIEMLRRKMGLYTSNTKQDKILTNHIGMDCRVDSLDGRWQAEATTAGENPESAGHESQALSQSSRGTDMKNRRLPVRALLLFLSPLCVVFLLAGVGSSQTQSGKKSEKPADETQKTDFTVGRSPGAIVFDGNSIWVANQLGDNVTKLGSDGTVLGTYPVGTRPVSLAFDGEHIWVANKFSNNIMKLQVSDGALLDTIKVGRRPEALLFDGHSLWVANGEDGTVTKFRQSDGASCTFFVGTRPVALAFDGSSVWVANNDSGNVTKLRADDGASLGTFNAGREPNGIAFDGVNIWVTNFYGKSVARLQPDGTFRDRIAVEDGPAGITFVGGYILVANYGGRSVSQIEPGSGKVIKTITVGRGPTSVAFDGVNIWVANASSNSVSKVKGPPRNATP